VRSIDTDVVVEWWWWWCVSRVRYKKQGGLSAYWQTMSVLDSGVDVAGVTVHGLRPDTTYRFRVTGPPTGSTSRGHLQLRGAVQCCKRDHLSTARPRPEYNNAGCNRYADEPTGDRISYETLWRMTVTCTGGKYDLPSSTA